MGIALICVLELFAMKDQLTINFPPSLKKTRLDYVDVLKVFASILVVVGHSAYYQMMTEFGGINYDLIMAQNNIADTRFHYWLCYVVNIIYSFHMPLFFCISGLLLEYGFERNKDLVNNKYNNIKLFIIDKFKRLILPFFVVGLCYSVPIKYLSTYYDKTLTSSNWGGGVVHDVFYGQILLQGNNYLWFCVSLFIGMVVIYLLRQCRFHWFVNLLFLYALHLYSFKVSDPFLFLGFTNAIWVYIGCLVCRSRNDLND